MELEMNKIAAFWSFLCFIIHWSYVNSEHSYEEKYWDYCELSDKFWNGVFKP